MEFRTLFDRKRVHSNLGTRVKELYTAVVSDSGSIDLVVDGFEDTYAYIQSFKDSVDINLILARYANGDMSALNKVQAHYGDFTSFPKTYAEALQAVIDAENMFMDLPVDVRAKFGHDSNVFISQIGTPEWMDALGYDKSVDKPVDESVVSPDVVVGGDVIES